MPFAAYKANGPRAPGQVMERPRQPMTTVSSPDLSRVRQGSVGNPNAPWQPSRTVGGKRTPPPTTWTNVATKAKLNIIYP
uniref:Uncharacterized protein n=1 Tax=Papilio xuthus TaxID=66420 RepID=I4DKL1_PAPXU|nr:unknown unsecreted protein [Papilio xuthus]